MRKIIFNGATDFLGLNWLNNLENKKKIYIQDLNKPVFLYSYYKKYGYNLKKCMNSLNYFNKALLTFVLWIKRRSKEACSGINL